MTRAAPAPEHICWSYDDPESFGRYARTFLHAGLSAGERVWYVPGRRSSGVTGWLLHAAPAWPDGAVRVFEPADVYAGDGTFDPVAQTARYATATEDALTAGFTGLRVVADATALVRTRPRLDAFVRYEYAIGRYLRTAPLRALCVYDRTVLGEQALTELACVHGRTNAGYVPFHLYAGRTAGDTVLAGEVDAASEDLFRTVLERAELRPFGGEVTVHAEGLTFITHRCMLALQRLAERRSLTVVIRTGLRTVAALAETLDLNRIRVETLG